MGQIGPRCAKIAPKLFQQSSKNVHSLSIGYVHETNKKLPDVPRCCAEVCNSVIADSVFSICVQPVQRSVLLGGVAVTVAVAVADAVAVAVVVAAAAVLLLFRYLSNGGGSLSLYILLHNTIRASREFIM